MKPVLLLVLCLGMAAASIRAASPALPVELNGLTRLPGFQCACFTLNQPGHYAAAHFMLTEGETCFGIRLLKIESALNRVQIQYGNQTRYLHICDTPDLTSSAGPENTANDGGSPNSRDSNQADPSVPGGIPDLTEIVDGNPVIKPALAGANAGGGAAAPKADPNAPASANPNPAIALKDQAGTDWYQQSLGIEQNRVADAQAVLAGEQTPWPRTPLTPAGTAPGLVGDDTLFPSHIPGFYR